jgi:putative hydrolase of the HAD superfamily
MRLRDHGVLTFDVVGTLIDFETGIADCLQGLAHRAGLAPGREALLAAFARAEDRQQRENPETPFTQMLEPICGDIAGEVGLPTGQAETTALRDSIPTWPAFPDSVDALAVLGDRFRLVALTNSDNWALEQMSAALGSPFDDTVTAEDVGVNKPSPRVFEYCRGRQSVHGWALADFLHVAQSQYHDIAVARSLGFHTCWIERRRGFGGWGATPAPPEVVVPDYHYASLAELADAIESGS